MMTSLTLFLMVDSGVCKGGRVVASAKSEKMTRVFGTLSTVGLMLAITTIEIEDVGGGKAGFPPRLATNTTFLWNQMELAWNTFSIINFDLWIVSLEIYFETRD